MPAALWVCLLNIGLVVAVVFFAVRSRRCAAARLADMQRELEDRRRAEAALKAAAAHAESANAAKSEFLTHVSHELRTPMNAVIGFTDLLMLDADLHPEQRDQLKIIRERGSDVLRMLGDILDLSRVEAGSVVVVKSCLNFKHLVSESIRLVAHEASRKGILLQWDVAADVPDLLFGDALRIRQVLANLLSNAVKFTSAGAVSVHVRTDAKEGLVVTVSDTGEGIPPDRLDSVFETFRRIDGPAGRRTGGLGIGLTVAQRLVVLMGGRLRVESEAGKGSQFHFTLPLELPPPQAVAPVRTPASDAAYALENPTVRILLVEDDPSSRLLSQKALERHGAHTIVTAGDGRSAVEAFKAGEFDLVLMDLQMYPVSGYQATSQIREIELSRGGHTRIVAVTAHGMKGDRERGMAAGVDEYLIKPVDPVAILAQVDVVLAARKAASPAQR